MPPAVPGSGSTALPVPGDRDAAPDGAPDGDRGPRPSLRVGTVVWGLVIAIIGAGLIAIASGARFDVELAFIGLLALAGIALVVGSVVTGARRRR
ncbi:hypothetical protein [Cellulomonas sp. ATA003]|uniref:hypothetical protein n=1 Tax=Cellulomonas sp. ATA003 TaxID=3073064 RepID=UPI002873F34D|nr:hypothetical protein [Cellulomonas sp. ATA003]WNB86070.1 hypothetical protein REH70_01920 [Cellulomonas sp. ATA003]